MESLRALCLACLLVTGVSTAAPVIQVPEGGPSVPVTAKGTLCGPVRAGWTLSPDGRSLKPPARVEQDDARILELKVAPTGGQCETTEERVTVIATGPFPRVDAAGTNFFPDEGRVELRGTGLSHVGVAWSGTPRTVAEPTLMEGQDVCLTPSVERGPGNCTVPVARGLPTDAALYWTPPHGRWGKDVTTFDASGNVVDPETFRLRPGRVVLTQPLIQSAGVDVSRGPGFVALSHSEALASVDCGPVRCEVNEGSVSLRNVPGVDVSVTLRLRLAPRIYFARGEALDQVLVETLPVLACPLTAVDGTVLRDAENSAMVVRLDVSCQHDPRKLLWAMNDQRARVERVVKASDGTYVLLRTGGTSEQQVTVSAQTSRVEGSVVASDTTRTQPLPVPRASLELGDQGTIDFIPINRPAELHVAASGEQGRFVPRPVAGAYTVTTRDGTTYVQGEPTAGGFVSLRFGYQLSTLPGELATTDLVVVTERVQRSVREASVPIRVESVVELVCADKDGKDRVLEPSRPHRIDYAMRNSCRVVIHRERLKPEQGAQEVVLRIGVTKPDGSARGESQVEQRMLLRPQGETRTIPVPGQLGQFDRILVQVSLVADESRYALSTADRSGLPSAQWTAIVSGGRLRLYTTATIPAGLYRATEPSGQLILNFGVVSRLALLNDEGQERLLGFEMGLMGMGLIPQSGDIEFPPTLAVVMGLSLRVPIGPGAAVGAQAWVAREFRDDITRRSDGSVVDSSRWSFIFGPSISVGNVGFNL
ncbi:hypothetical protein VZQ01_24365 [Myxococcus faecalis]|uniref:hypothetical protein n=1 Tax=Myxococcus TaxID=32 RepID=UPI001CC0EBD4|nr:MULTISPECIES: hypothetical protein [unclassified Myxococcus]MBZ4396392.1 hypothetical protein [Myxococcus sp. AS-1-15]MBZ4412981.1 hypothetical protein [Myxococcus sp. XM-1-1-1]BDT37902.1 hypothetical protein MFMH1_75710 [Myxococcus sp. MH1]